MAKTQDPPVECRLLPVRLTEEQLSECGAALYRGFYDRVPKREGAAPVPEFETLGEDQRALWSYSAAALLGHALQTWGSEPAQTGAENLVEMREIIESLKKRLRSPKQINDLEAVLRLLKGVEPAEEKQEPEIEANQLPDV